MKSFFWVCLSSLTYLTRLKFFNVFFFSLSLFLYTKPKVVWEEPIIYLSLDTHSSLLDRWLVQSSYSLLQDIIIIFTLKISNTDKDDLMSIIKRKRRILLKSYCFFFFSLVRLLFWGVNTYNAWNETISNDVNVLIIYANNLTYKVEKVSILYTYTYKLVSI